MSKHLSIWAKLWNVFYCFYTRRILDLMWMKTRDQIQRKRLTSMMQGNITVKEDIVYVGLSYSQALKYL